ncbi:N-acetyltransferase GCN5 [Halomonas sp. GFAJ-1]|nr:GCN5 family acetyltransferase [Halomonas sp. GFAJ-1]EHK62138.1 N-acetyltransferase GCN5 [Halomonas sp. GFAJ-1]
MELKFRETREADIEQLFAVRGRTRENPIPKERLAVMGITPKSTAAAMKAGAICSWVSVHEHQVVGFCSGDLSSGEVLVLAVLPEYEGRGVGRQLLSHVVQDLRTRGQHTRLWLAASPDPRIRAHGFYRTHGWNPTGEWDANGDEILVLGLPQPTAA